MIITCDDREPKKMDELAEQVGGITFDRKRLTTGDYISGDVIIERKTINDFCGSIKDGRLKGQIAKMKASPYKHIYILISGHISTRTSDIHEHSILGMMASILVKHNISIITVETDKHLVYIMKRIFERHSEALI